MRKKVVDSRKKRFVAWARKNHFSLTPNNPDKERILTYANEVQDKQMRDCDVGHIFAYKNKIGSW